VKNHDVHHRLPESNYGQYIMLWDYLFGSYRPYTEKTTDNQATPATDEAPTRMPTRASARKAVKIQ
jgi:sterol desaturase/sphingolipid hydroxylase (fatty acid hydroxylase superfamily)